jgi:hypothetical protein
MSQFETIQLVVALLITPLALIVWHFLRQKDIQQQAAIELLFAKHDADAKELADLKLQIASRHYEKSELDAKLDRLLTTMQDSQREVTAKIDRLTEALLAEMASGR